MNPGGVTPQSCELFGDTGMLCVCDPGVSLLKVVNFSKIRDVCDLILGVSLLHVKL